jgi:hypothetical protein
MRVSGVAFLALGLLPIGALAQELPPPERYTLRVEYREWRPKLSSEIQYGAGGVTGTLLDVERDLGIMDERTFELHGSLQFKPGHRLRFSWTPLDYAGDVIVARSFTFGGRTYTVSSRVVTDLSGDLFSGGYEWDFLKSGKGYLGAFVGGQAFTGDAALEVPDLNVRERRSLTAFEPLLGLGGRTYAGRFSLEGQVSGLVAGRYGYSYELSGSARLHLSDRAAVQGGYRLVRINAKDEPDRLRLRLGGWTFGVELSL